MCFLKALRDAKCWNVWSYNIYKWIEQIKRKKIEYDSSSLNFSSWESPRWWWCHHASCSRSETRQTAGGRLDRCAPVKKKIYSGKFPVYLEWAVPHDCCLPWEFSDIETEEELVVRALLWDPRFWFFYRKWKPSLVSRYKSRSNAKLKDLLPVVRAADNSVVVESNASNELVVAF